MIYETIYKKLDKLIPLGVKELQKGERIIKLKSEGYMNLNVDSLRGKEHPNGDLSLSLRCFIIAMAHNYTQNGDVMADPDMEIAVYPETKMAEALTYQQDGLGIYNVVYPEPGLVNVRMKKELNSFLNQWLDNLKKQNFY